jgi:hypothetical protein
VSAGLDDKHIGSGDGSHVRVTGGKSSCVRIVSDFSELSQIVHTVPLPGQALQVLPVLSPLSSFFIGTTNFLSLFLLRFALGDVDICLSFI